MIRRSHGQRSVFEVLLPNGEKLWSPVLRPIDEVLEDEGLGDAVVEALERRRPGSRKKGRPGTPADVVLRMLVLKHLYDWSFDACERGVRGSLVWRAFRRIDCETVPDAKTLIRLSQAVGGDTLKKISEGSSPHDLPLTGDAHQALTTRRIAASWPTASRAQPWDEEAAGAFRQDGDHGA